MTQPGQSTSFGQYIDTLIRLYASISGKGLTAYIKDDLSNDKSDAHNRLSSRQIARMRDISHDEFPEGKGLAKLLDALPAELQTLNSTDLCNRTLAPWEPVRVFQKEVIQKSSDIGVSMTIVSGRKPPLALSDPIVISAMTKAIEQNVRYTFLYPAKETYRLEAIADDPETITQSWVRAIRRRITRAWEEQQEKEAIERGLSSQSAIDEDAFVSEERLSQFETKVKSNITARHTQIDTDFWFFLPSDYVVFYNLESEYENKDVDRYGVFRVAGNPIIRASAEEIEKNGGQPIETKGWLRMSDETYQALASLYKQMPSELPLSTSKSRKKRN
ncbi:hypothetical protein IQ235_01130 [Oscillatoriales cyanobacterium LEGE 11467]|uniref:Uncharacterized protein n=1 Tax=Zarconia navalis LEGE 11467 TaxID=1828826 RepID=A0A928Z779_9CYAN|nr:hypothetical protein [Zarconia navalis]MBE9039398.1 hypothetical protein [Zarconia navalis LEGE 11467]